MPSPIASTSISLLSGAASFLDHTLSFVFQPICVICGNLSNGQSLCLSCNRFSLMTGSVCSRCGYSVSETTSLCGECFQLPYPMPCRSLLWYGDKERAILHQIKYRGRFEYLKLFYPIFEREIKPHFPMDVVVVPTPLYSKRLIHRTFNQSELIARWFSKKFGLKVIQGLKKTKNTPPQSQLRRSQRLRNLRNSIVWDEKITCPKNILLVDDVFTTGTTMRRSAKVIAEKGANIFAWTLFRTPRKLARP